MVGVVDGQFIIQHSRLLQPLHCGCVILHSVIDIRRIGICLGTCWVLVFSLLPAPVRAQVRTIYRIEIERANVFPDTTAVGLPSILRLANRLHPRTRPGVIRREILFQERDTLDLGRIRESERLLRQRGLFESARIDVAGGDSGSVVTVRTQDLWSFSLILDAEKQADFTSFTIGMADANILGTGNSLSWVQVFSSDQDQFVARAFLPRLRPTRASASVYYLDQEDARARSAGIARRIETPYDRWIGGIEGAAIRGRFRAFAEGEETGEAPYRSESFSAHLGIGTPGVTQGTAGLAWAEKRIEPRGEPKSFIRGLPPPDPYREARFGGPILFAGMMQRQFVLGRNLERYGNVEDVPLGWSLHLGLGANLHRDDDPDHAGWLGLSAATAILPFRGIGAGASIGASWFLREEGDPGEQIVRALGSARWQPSPRRITIAQVSGAIGAGRPRSSAVYFGADSGPRGFPIRTFEARDYILATVEHRYWTGLEILWVGLGANLFADAILPSADGRIDDERWKSGWGCGLLLGLVKSSQRPIRIEVAWRTDRKDDPTVSITTSTPLRFIPWIGLPSPVAELDSSLR